MSLLPPSLDPLVMKVVAQPPVPSRDWQPPRSFNERLFTRPPQSACRSLRFVYYCRGGSSVDGISMEPSSTAFRRAVALLTIAASLSLASSAACAGRGVVSMGRVQAIRAACRSPRARESPCDRHESSPGPRSFQSVPSVRRTFAALCAVFGGYRRAAAPVFADGDDVGAQVVPYERPVCVRPLITQIKQVRHAGHLPRVIYGRPPIC